MLSEIISHDPQAAPRPAFDLMPWGIVTGASAPCRESRLIEAQGAMNRIQVWIADLFIALAAYRAQHRPGRLRIHGVLRGRS